MKEISRMTAGPSSQDREGDVARLCREAMESHFTRRQFVERALLLGLSTTALGSLASACGGETGGSSGGTGKTIATYTMIREPYNSLDPAIDTADGPTVFWNVYDSLVKYNGQTKSVEPDLATDYIVSKDGKTWTFNLRKGIKFHDGTDFDANDVKATIDYYQRMNQGGTWIWSVVKDVEVKDPYTVVFHLKYPAPLDLIATASTASQIISGDALKKHGDKWLSDGNEAGTGPYIMESHTADSVVLARFPQYWKGWEGQHFDKVLLKKVAEAATRRQMVESGECDVTNELTPNDLAALAKNQNLSIVAADCYRNLLISVLCDRKPTSDVRVRQALAYAMPYDSAIEAAVGGFGKQAMSVVPSNLWGTATDATQYGTDLDKAKQLLAEAGYPDGGLTLTGMYLSGDEPKRKVMELFKASLAQLNIDLKLRSGPWGATWEEAKGKNPPDLFSMWWWPTYVDPSDWLYSLCRSEDEVYYNLARYKNSKVDSLIDNGQMKSASNREAATKDFVDAQKIIMQDVPWIPVLEAKTVYVTQKSLQGFVPNPAYDFTVEWYPCQRA